MIVNIWRVHWYAYVSWFLKGKNLIYLFEFICNAFNKSATLVDNLTQGSEKIDNQSER